MAALVDALYADHGEAIESVAREMTPCTYCESQHYEAFVLRDLLERALVDVLESGTPRDED